MENPIAKSTGLPSRTPSQQYKGFITEEYFKQTLKINALAKGVPDWKIGVYTNGVLPDGTVLSGIDEHVDISVWTRKHPWSKLMRTVDYQSKIFNDDSKYKKVFNDPKYQNVKHVDLIKKAALRWLMEEFEHIISTNESELKESAEAQAKQ